MPELVVTSSAQSLATPPRIEQTRRTGLGRTRSPGRSHRDGATASRWVTSAVMAALVRQCDMAFSGDVTIDMRDLLDARGPRGRHRL